MDELNQNGNNYEEPEINDDVEMIEETLQLDEDQPNKFSLKKEVFDWTLSIVIALIVALIIKNFVFTLVRVEGTSMIPTLANSDTLYVNRLNYTPKVGDIIILRPPNNVKTPYVKRVIAMENQVVDINTETGEVKVDGEVLQEDYINEIVRTSGTIAYPFTVPEGCVFVMGDNRNASRDSRDVTVGPIPLDNVVGHALFRLWPLNTFGAIK